MTLRKCCHCDGTGWDSPPRPGRRPCRECGGEGEVDETHAWAGYEAVVDCCAGGIKCPLPRRGDPR
jgi:DnaJ-class molecular chaperone